MRQYTKKATQPRSFFSNSITITGKTGVGTTTAMSELQKILGITPYRWVSGGGIMRGFARNMGMTIEEFTDYCSTHTKEGYDRKCDRQIERFGRQDYCIVEARLGHVFVPSAFHVLLKCNTLIRAERRKTEFLGKSVLQVVDIISKRDEYDDLRYQTLYPGCLWPESDFDLVIDTELIPANLVDSVILGAHSEWVQRLDQKVLRAGR